MTVVLQKAYFKSLLGMLIHIRKQSVTGYKFWQKIAFVKVGLEILTEKNIVTAEFLKYRATNFTLY